jgi:hypothetical protein
LRLSVGRPPAGPPAPPVPCPGPAPGRPAYDNRRSVFPPRHCGGPCPFLAPDGWPRFPDRPVRTGVHSGLGGRRPEGTMVLLVRLALPLACTALPPGADVHARPEPCPGTPGPSPGRRRCLTSQRCGWLPRAPVPLQQVCQCSRARSPGSRLQRCAAPTDPRVGARGRAPTARLCRGRPPSPWRAEPVRSSPLLAVECCPWLSSRPAPGRTGPRPTGR